VEFGILYLPNNEGQISLPNLRQFVFAMSPFFVAVISTKYLVLSFMVAGIAGVYPRWELFHFQPALPFLAIAIATFLLDKKFKRILKYIPFVLLLLFLAIGIKRQVGTTTRFYEEDVQAVGSLITNTEAQITSLYVINYWDNLYALTNTTPPKPLIPYIPWYLDYNNNLDLILNNLKTEMPKVIVIGKREKTNSNLYDFVDKYYSCTFVEKEVELCSKN